MSKLQLTYDETLLPDAPVENIQLDCGRQEHYIKVKVDGSENINHFTVSCDDDWITVKRLRNDINIVVSENTTSSDRFGRMVFTHNLDAEKQIYLILAQSKPHYALSASVGGDVADSVMINTLLGHDDDECETACVEITCEGGLEDYIIRTVVEYARPRESDGYRLVPYDNGIKVVKANDHELNIVNFGKISKYNDMYYEVIIAHRNDFNTICRIKVRYSDEGGSGFEIDDGYYEC